MQPKSMLKENKNLSTSTYPTLTLYLYNLHRSPEKIQVQPFTYSTLTLYLYTTTYKKLKIPSPASTYPILCIQHKTFLFPSPTFTYPILALHFAHRTRPKTFLSQVQPPTLTLAHPDSKNLQVQSQPTL